MLLTNLHKLNHRSERRYFNFTVRQLYNLVIKSITKPSQISYSDNSFSFIPLDQRRHSVAGYVISENSKTFRGHGHGSLSMARNESMRLSDVKAKKKDHAVTYRERLGGHLHPRDMRRLVIPFSATNEPELIVRRHVILLNFDPLRAIILRDRLFVIVPDGADSILEKLEARVQGLNEAECSDFDDPIVMPIDPDVAQSELTPLMSQKTLDNTIASQIQYTENVQPSDLYTTGPSSKSEEEEEDGDDDDDEFGQLDDDEIEELECGTFINLPFELLCVDAVLHSAIDWLASRSEEVLESTQLAMEQVLKPETGVGSFAQETLRNSKNNVHEMETQVQGFVRALTQVLNEDEDMALCNLSRLITHPERFIQPVSRAVLEEESDEPELILVSSSVTVAI
jgi:magnesium transporter